MAFITQKNQSNCGAYALAYWKWLETGEPSEKEQVEEVEEITSSILFGEDAPFPALAQYCDPAKMINYLTSVRGLDRNQIKFYSGEEGGPVDGLLKLMLNMLPEDPGSEHTIIIKNWLQTGLVIRQTLPESWQRYLISLAVALFREPGNHNAPTTEELSNSQRIHYVLVRRGDSNTQVYNSWDGFARPGEGYLQNKLLATGTHAESDDPTYYNRLYFLRAGILIPKTY